MNAMETLKTLIDNCNTYEELNALSAQFYKALNERRKDTDFRQSSLQAVLTKEKNLNLNTPTGG